MPDRPPGDRLIHPGFSYFCPHLHDLYLVLIMKLLQHRGEDPRFNLALEEYLLRHTSEDMIILWCSRPAVIIGKHQNAWAEVNFPYVYGKGIPVLRRLSGGGTVFHGRGNLNFTLVKTGETGKLVDFRKHTAAVVGFLNKMGVPARFEGKNDLRVDGLKVSGNAEHVYKNRLLHHGTLLFDAPLHDLNEAIRVRQGRYRDKSVQSVRSKVTNIAEQMGGELHFDAFREGLGEHMMTQYGAEAADPLSADAIASVHRLVQEKYGRWEWNIGYSPDYFFRGSAPWKGRAITLEMRVTQGLIREVHCAGHGSEYSWDALVGEMAGIRHDPPDLLKLLVKHGLAREGAGMLPDFAQELFF